MKAKKPSHMRHPIPVRSAMRSILFIVPRNRFLVPSKPSFIFSAKAVESLISSPIAIVICVTISLAIPTVCCIAVAHILQHLDLLRHDSHLLVVLALQLVVYCVRISPFLVRCRRPKPAVSAPPPSNISTIRPWICAECAIHGRLRAEV